MCCMLPACTAAMMCCLPGLQRVLVVCVHCRRPGGSAARGAQHRAAAGRRRRQLARGWPGDAAAADEYRHGPQPGARVKAAAANAAHPHCMCSERAWARAWRMRLRHQWHARSHAHSTVLRAAAGLLCTPPLHQLCPAALCRTHTHTHTPPRHQFFTRPFVAGDSVTCQGGGIVLNGVVERVTAMRTTLRTDDDVIVTIPNKVHARPRRQRRHAPVAERGLRCLATACWPSSHCWHDPFAAACRLRGAAQTVAEMVV